MAVSVDPVAARVPGAVAAVLPMVDGALQSLRQAVAADRQLAAALAAHGYDAGEVVGASRLADGSVRQWPLTQAEWFAQGDGNRDGRVTRSEYFSRLLPPVQSMFGVPESWQPGDGKRPARIAPPD